jgi:Ca-activated chloride channel family protein
VRGEIRKRDEARRIYEQARREGRVAALLDQERPNIFSQQVTHILPGHEIRVRIRYVECLAYEDGAYEMIFPTVVGPRFIPGQPLGMPRLEPAASPGGAALTRGEAPAASGGTGWAQDTDRVPDASRITPPVIAPGRRTGHDIGITVDLDAGVPLLGIGCASHAVDIEKRGRNRARVRLRPTDTLPNKDFVLRYHVAGGSPEIGFLAHRDGGDPKGPGYFALHLVPASAISAREARPKELIFLLDTSGSMHGEPMARSKAAMRWALQSLGPDDTFQIIRFSDRTSTFSPAPVPNTPENVQRALVYVDRLEGEGGTHMLAGIETALRIRPDPDRLRIVCLLTDGYIGNETEILAAVRQDLGEARLFSFGVGSSVNRYLLDALAEEGRGVVDYVPLDGDTRPIVERFYARIARPHLTDLAIDWGDLDVEGICPEPLPDLFAGQTLVVSGRYRAGGRSEVVVRGRLGRRAFERRLPVVLPEREPENAALGTLWARRRIDALMRLMVPGEQEALAREVTETALAFHLVSRYTSFVAADNQVVSKDGEPMLVPQPVEMPAGVSYEGVFGLPDAAASGQALNRGVVIQSGKMHLRGGRSAEMSAFNMPAPSASPPPPPPASVSVPHGLPIESSDAARAVTEAETRLETGTLEVTLEVERPRVLVGERARIRITVRNHGGSSIQVPEVLTWLDLGIRVQRDGQAVARQTPAGRGRSRTLALAPGAERRYTLVLSEAPGQPFAGPGRYEIEVVAFAGFALPEPHARGAVRIE